jgi:hypothetical protein
VAELLTTLGYTSPAAEDATNPDPSGLDFVYYTTPEFEASAQQVAADLGLTPESVAPFPDPPPADPGLAQVVVVLGANGTLATTATGTTPTSTPG